MKRVQGYSLAEIMITLAILSFGLLGVAGIALNSLKGSQTAHVRALATLQANDIIARMRANRNVAERIPSPYNLSLNADARPGASVPEADLSQWRSTLASSLPEGKGSVSVNPSNQKVTVVVQWMQRSLDKTRPSAPALAQRIMIETRL